MKFENFFIITSSTHPTRGHWTSSRLAPAGFAEENRWRLWRDDPGDATLLYACRVAEHNLLTPDPNCEGLLPLGPVGWIHNAPGPGRVELYRCRVDATGDHFVSESATCDGHVVEQLLGYAVD